MKTEFSHGYDVGDSVYYKLNDQVAHGIIDQLMCTKRRFRDKLYITYDIQDSHTHMIVGNIYEQSIALTPNELFDTQTTVTVDITTTQGKLT